MFRASRPIGSAAVSTTAMPTGWREPAFSHAFDQNRFAPEFDEVATPGYTLVSAELSYTARMTGLGDLGQEITIGLKGENLADDVVLNHASFQRREEVLLPGANVRLFGSIKLN